MKRKADVVATVIVALAYFGLALSLSTAQQTYFVMIGFGVVFFAITTAYVAILLHSNPRQGMKVTLRVSGVIAMIVVYFAVWNYWGIMGPWWPITNLGSSSINFFCFGAQMVDVSSSMHG